ncbi:hypothetical protein OCU04_008576 [Sclerotinia nivalis]|uniref:Uncharacterized protein n=1 Tax=Sclerotinia nivalis TaxID=352851 RepID=A0A9X0DJT2_9HELO|nr:hypothetical protein OCU04_008576 [Sclerotinia nivalis]
MSSKPAKKVHYTSSTKGSSVHGGPSSTPPTSSKPASSTRRPSFSHQRHPSDSGVGSSSSNSATAQVNSTSFYTDAERAEQRQNVRALNEALNTLKDRVKTLELKNRDLEETLAESNREKRELRRERDEFLRTIEELKKDKNRAKDTRDGKDSDGIRVRGSDTKSTPEKKERSDRNPATMERNTPPMTRREKERDSDARKREEERLRAQNQTRERRTSYRDAPPSPIYRDDERDVNPMSPNSRYRDEEHAREKRNSGTPPTSKLPNPFTPLSPIGSSASAGRARRASVSYGTSPGGYTSAPQAYSGMTMGSSYGRRERDEVPYIRGEVPVSVNVGVAGTRGSRLSGGSVGSASDDVFPNDGKYHPYPLEI